MRWDFAEYGDSHQPDEVLTALRNTKDWFEARIKEQFSSQPWMQCEVAFLSDTIAVSMALAESTENREAMSVVYLADVISWVLDRVLRSSVPLAYRGAIAVGNYEVSPHSLIGQAIDEAASAHELAQGAIIWLTPGARAHVARWLLRQPNNTHLVFFDVPLKGAGYVQHVHGFASRTGWWRGGRGRSNPKSTRCFF